VDIDPAVSAAASVVRCHVSWPSTSATVTPWRPWSWAFTDERSFRLDLRLPESGKWMWMRSNATYASGTTLTVAVGDALAAGAVGALLSGVPSTTVTVLRGESLLDGATAAGSIVLPAERRTLPLVAAAVPVHLALSLGWAAVMSALLPRRATVPAAVAGALAIAALDLELIGRAFPRIRALPQGRQWADHVAYGLAVGVVVRRRRLSRATRSGA
jgi:hypothetical protein